MSHLAQLCSPVDVFHTTMDEDIDTVAPHAPAAFHNAQQFFADATAYCGRARDAETVVAVQDDLVRIIARDLTRALQVFRGGLETLAFAHDVKCAMTISDLVAASGRVQVCIDVRNIH